MFMAAPSSIRVWLGISFLFLEVEPTEDFSSQMNVSLFNNMDSVDELPWTEPRTPGRVVSAFNH